MNLKREMNRILILMSAGRGELFQDGQEWFLRYEISDDGDVTVESIMAFVVGEMVANGAVKLIMVGDCPTAILNRPWV